MKKISRVAMENIRNGAFMTGRQSLGIGLRHIYCITGIEHQFHSSNYRSHACFPSDGPDHGVWPGFGH